MTCDDDVPAEPVRGAQEAFAGSTNAVPQPATALDRTTEATAKEAMALRRLTPFSLSPLFLLGEKQIALSLSA